MVPEISGSVLAINKYRFRFADIMKSDFMISFGISAWVRSRNVFVSVMLRSKEKVILLTLEKISREHVKCCSVIGELKVLTKLKCPYWDSKPQRRTRYERTAVKTPFQVILLSFIRSYWCDESVKWAFHKQFSFINMTDFKAYDIVMMESFCELHLRLYWKRKLRLIKIFAASY